MSVDVAGYVGLMQADEQGTHARLMACRASIIAPAVSRAGGRIVKGTGDGVLAELPSAAAAATCAMEIQRAMRERSATAPVGQQLTLRIGLTVGDILVEPDDIYGETVNLAVRLQTEARPGGICVGQAVREAAATALGSAVRFEPLGARALKHLSRPVAAWHLEAPEVGQDDVSRPMLWDVPAVAFLPFVIPGGGVEEQTLADGLVDDLIAALGSCRWFPVIARQSSFIYRDSQLASQQIARELGAEYLVDGTVRRTETQLRISMRLTEGRSGRQIWAGEATRPLEQFYATQSDLLVEIGNALELELARNERRRAATFPEASGLDAYILLQRGHWHLVQRRQADHAEAFRLFREAVALAPTYAQARAALAWTTALAAERGWINRPRREVFDEASDHAQEAVRLGPEFSSTWHVLGEISLLRDDSWNESLNAFEESIALNPSNVAARARMASPLACTGQPRAAIDAVARATRLSPRDPRRPIWMFGLSIAHCLLGEHDAALAAIRLGLQFRPDEAGAYHLLAINLAHLDRRSEAAEAYRKLVRLEPDAMERGEYFAQSLRDQSAGSYWLEGLQRAARWAE